MSGEASKRDAGGTASDTRSSVPQHDLQAKCFNFNVKQGLVHAL